MQAIVMPRRTKKLPRSAKEISAFALTVLDDLKAENVLRLDVRHLTSLLDVMIVASGRSDRHVRAVANALIERAAQAGIALLGVEGKQSGEWVLVDLADVVVHVMLPRTRAFYELEKLWDIAADEEVAERL